MDANCVKKNKQSKTKKPMPLQKLLVNMINFELNKTKERIKQQKLNKRERRKKKKEKLSQLTSKPTMEPTISNGNNNNNTIPQSINLTNGSESSDDINIDQKNNTIQPIINNKELSEKLLK